VRYYDFLWRVFVEEEQLQWSSVVELLCPRRTPSQNIEDSDILKAEEIGEMVRERLPE
jgi:hypothetical protein